MTATPSGFDQFGVVRYVDKDTACIIIKNALGIYDEYEVEKLWNDWAQRERKIRADKLGMRLFFHTGSSKP